ncbi:hypothetical protein NTGBS_230001 [Candidatus Nitrotoga sp. BS]|nr:hypothetical protein NTGBS_230001 [Candidatus Nitrotoga sp. BS]
MPYSLRGRTAVWGFTPQKPINKAYEQRPSEVKAWLAKHQDEIEVFYLPSDGPELNPDEMLNADLKQAVTTKAPAQTKGQLLKMTTSHMRKLQKSPERVKSDFEHAPVKYAALGK